MKHGKKLTKKMKIDLVKAGIDPEKYLYVKCDTKRILLLDKETKKLKVVLW